MTARQYVIDASTRHQVFVQRYAAGESKKAVKALSWLSTEITRRLSLEPTQFQRDRLVAVLKDINELSGVAYGDIANTTIESAKALASLEAEYSARMYNRISSAEFALPSTSQLLAAVERAPMVPMRGSLRVSLADSLSRLGKRKSAQISDTITAGVTLGDTTQTIAKSVGTIINTLHKRQVTALVHTAANHASSVAREQLYYANSDILDGYEWVSTLDRSTTLICAGRDGTVFQVGIGPMPPAHWNCRSTTIPVVDPKYTAAAPGGTRPSVGADGAETQTAGTTYGGWLKKQPKKFIDEALGVERSKLFRSGEISIEGFTDPTGRMYTLQQLRDQQHIALQ